MNGSKKVGVVYFLVADTLILSTTLLLSFYFNGGPLSHRFDLLLILGLASLWFFIVSWRKLYDSSFYEDYGKRLLNFVKSSSILIFLLGVIYLVFTFPPNYRHAVLGFSIGFPLAGIAANFVVISVLNRVGKRAAKTRYSLVAEPSKPVGKTAAYSGEPELAYHGDNGFMGYDNDGGDVEEDKGPDEIGHMRDYIVDHHVDEIVITVPIKKTKKMQEIMDLADYHGKRVKIVPDYQSLVVNGKKAGAVKTAAVNLRPTPLDSSASSLLKESFDWAFSTVALVLLLPVFLVIAVLIKLDSPRPVFYCPIRIGKGGKPFKLYKFSTMRESDPVDGGKNSTQKDDPRITKLGAILRKYSPDELPQFINVFLGDMSVVGPRPHRSFLNEQLPKSEENYMIRLYYKPGITGWAQVNGWRGPTDTPERKRERTAHDLWYVENWSFKLDIRIIWMTIFGKKTHKTAF